MKQYIARKKPHHYKQNGFSLVEILLYVTILTIIITPITHLLYSISEAKAEGNSITEVDQQGAHIVQLLTQTIRNSSDINLPSQGNSGNSLSLNTFDPNTTPTLFDISNGIIRIKEGNGPYINLNSSQVTVSNLNFSNLSRNNTPGIIRTQFTLTYNNPSGKQEYDFTKTFTTSASLR